MPNFEIRKSSIAGEGIFATEVIAKDSPIGIGFEKIADTGNPGADYRRTTLGEKTNHSDAANVMLSRRGNTFYLIAAKPIHADEELFLDYKTFPWEGKREFKKRPRKGGVTHDAQK